MKIRKIVGASRRRGPARRAEQLARVEFRLPPRPKLSIIERELLQAAQGRAIGVTGRKKMRCQKNTPSVRGDKKRKRRADMIASILQKREAA